MLHEKFITDEEYQEALAEEIDVQPPRRSTATYTAAPWYVEHVRRLLEERYGGTARRAARPARAHRRRPPAAEHGRGGAPRGPARARSAPGLPRRGAPPAGAQGRRVPEARGERPQSADARTTYAVVTEVRSTGLLVRTPWEEAESRPRSPRLGRAPPACRRRSGPATSSPSPAATPTTAAARFAARPGPAGRRRARRHRPLHRPGEGDGRRVLLRAQPVQPRHAGTPAAGLGDQAAHLRRRLRPRLRPRRRSCSTRPSRFRAARAASAGRRRTRAVTTTARPSCATRWRCRSTR